ncbi:hypothetical protein ARMGADRAFT_284814 [Armillaria gallica]|uniref:Uncharacterized protein n=1 Tax=Armillaria gallica TaxID=47427 RepID=A0A2H3D6X6_ARMGA|nr:hypothetical protein ARMGADRAFT_284814 [Armillaria gallica]
MYDSKNERQPTAINSQKDRWQVGERIKRNQIANLPRIVILSQYIKAIIGRPRREYAMMSTVGLRCFYGDLRYYSTREWTVSGSNRAYNFVFAIVPNRPCI